jgi:hypothetical protein
MNIPLIIVFFFFFTAAFAQQTPAYDTTFLHEAVLNAVKQYETSLAEQSILYNGSEYAEPSRTENQYHPFFKSDDWLTGSVDYDGELFTDIPLMYDLTGDRLVTELPNATEVELITERLSAFTIDGHHFIKIKAEKNGLLKSGFYEVLYEGERRVIAWHYKSNAEKIVDQSVKKYFDEKNRYFILNNGIYYSVNNRSSFLKILSDQKTELKKFMKKNKLSFDKREETLAALAAYYDTLKKEVQ